MNEKHSVKAAVISFFLFALLFLLHYSDVISISIKTATPIILLPLLCAFSIFSTPAAAAATGLVLGVCMDSAASGTLCFNAIVLMLSAALVSASSSRLFNRNLPSAVLLSFLLTLFYFILRWLIFYAFTVSAQDNLTYLLHYAFPSVIYTNVFIFPFYFLYRKLRKGGSF